MTLCARAKLPSKITLCSALFPNIDNHVSVKNKGIMSVPLTNSRMVRPREIRAKNKPTNGDQATHHAQKNNVQLFIHSFGC